MSVPSPPPPPPCSSFPFVLACLLIFSLILNTPCILAAKTNNNNARSSRRQLSVDYYAKSCPQLEQLVGSVTSQQFKEAPVSGPATIRLFFHDCFVEVKYFFFNFNLHACTFRW